MDDERYTSNASFHLAGVVPLTARSLDFQFPWHDALQPISQNYLAVERAIVECAYAGCETIWVVCDDDVQPLVRYRLGDFIEDPVWLGRKFDKYPSESRKPIQIFYVPLHPHDRKLRTELSWSILYGALTAYRTCRDISKWVTPDRYYVSFPYGVYDPTLLRNHRAQISSTEPFFLRNEGRTIADGEYLGFTFGLDEYRELRQKIFSMNRKGVDLDLDKVFNCVMIESRAFVVDLPWYFAIDSWEGLCEYLSSEERRFLRRPSPHMLSFRELNPIGVDNDR